MLLTAAPPTTTGKPNQKPFAKPYQKPADTQYMRPSTTQAKRHRQSRIRSHLVYPAGTLPSSQDTCHPPSPARNHRSSPAKSLVLIR